MPTECSAQGFTFSRVEGRAVVAGFDGGMVSSDAGALLLGATDRAIGLIDRFASCFEDGRRQEYVIHRTHATVMQRVCAIALGYEDVNDHDSLRRDPVLGALAGCLEARHERCEPLAGKSTLNRSEHAPAGPGDRYHKIAHDPAAIEGLFVDLFVDAHLDRHDERQPTAALVRFHGLRADGRPAPPPSQDRRPGPPQRPAPQGRHAIGLSLAALVGPGIRPVNRRRGVSGKPTHPSITQDHRRAAPTATSGKPPVPNQIATSQTTDTNAYNRDGVRVRPKMSCQRRCGYAQSHCA